MEIEENKYIVPLPQGEVIVYSYEEWRGYRDGLLDAQKEITVATSVEISDYKRGYLKGYKKGREMNEPWKLPLPPNTICPTCGMKWEGVMSYYCPHNNCPIQPKAIA